MKYIEHLKDKDHTTCPHPGTRWDTALARAMSCMGVTASEAEENHIVSKIAARQGVWHRGFILTGYER